MTKKRRENVPIDLAAQVLFLSDRTCCVCRLHGRPIQIHHIDEDPGNNSLQNLAVLCLDCHHLTQIRGGFERRLDASQVLLYRDNWYRVVEEQRKPQRKVGMPKESDRLSKARESLRGRSQRIPSDSKVYLVSNLQAAFQDLRMSQQQLRRNQEKISRLLRNLTDRERVVLEMRYGLLGEKPRSQEEIADYFRASVYIISKLEKEALIKLENFLTQSQG